MRAALAAILCSLAAALPAAGDVVFGLPIDCAPGESCYVQHLVDRDPGPGATDYRCGGLTYDGHKGTDFAVPTRADMVRGVAVLAAAPGIVTALRDGMDDRLYTDADADRVSGRECGNGVVVDHGDGWETQYCHLRKGSLQVRKGQAVDRGDRLGAVGLSGKTQFPHVHLSVRRDGQVVDPFDPGAGPPDCGGGTPAAMWQQPFPHPPGGVVYAGFAAGVPEYAEVKNGTALRDRLPAQAPGLVLFALAYGGEAGDVVTLEIAGADGQILNHEATLTKPQAKFFRAAGRRLNAARWPAGTYTGRVTLRRDGAVLSARTARVIIP